MAKERRGRARALEGRRCRVGDRQGGSTSDFITLCAVHVAMTVFNT